MIVKELMIKDIENSQMSTKEKENLKERINLNYNY